MNGGASWSPIFDEQPVIAVSAVAVAPSNPSIVWAGTGDPLVFYGPIRGRGVFKSADAGEHWEQSGLDSAGFIGRILIHPTNSDILWVGVIGSLTSPSQYRGVYKTSDGGRTWTRVLFVNEWTGVPDLALDPTDPNIVYAATQQRATRAGVFLEYGPGSGLYRSRDGGVTWRKLVDGLPERYVQRVGVATTALRARVYARSRPDRGHGDLRLPRGEEVPDLCSPKSPTRTRGSGPLPRHGCRPLAPHDPVLRRASHRRCRGPGNNGGTSQ